MSKSKSNHVLTTALLMTTSLISTSLFSAQAMAKSVPPVTAVQTLRSTVDPFMAKQGKEISGITDDKRHCTVDLMGIDNIMPGPASDIEANNVVFVSLKVDAGDDEIPMEGAFTLDIKDEVKSLKTDANSLSIDARVEHSNYAHDLFNNLVLETNTEKESMKIEMSQDRISAVTIVNDKDQYRCNLN